MWELDYKESWAQNWCFWTVVLEKTLESPLDCKEIQPVHPKGDQSWVFIGRTDAEAEIPILWLPDEKSWLIWKTLMLQKIEGERRKGGQRMRWLDGITNSMDMSLSNSRNWSWTGRPGVLYSMQLQSRTWLSDWTELNWTELLWLRLLVLCCWELPGCAQTMTRSQDEKGTCKAALPHTGLSQGPNMSPREPLGRERNLQASCSPRGCLGARYVPFFFLFYCCWAFY